MKKILSALFSLIVLVFALLPTTKVMADSLQITSTTLPAATIGQPYSTQMAASGGTPPYKWSLVSTNYPAGCCVLGLNGDSGLFNTQTSAVVTNTYPAATYSWGVQVTDAAGNSVTGTVSLPINNPPTGGLTVSPTTLNFNASNPNGLGITLSGITGQWIATLTPVASWLRINGSNNGATGIISSTPLNATVDPNSQLSMSPGSYTGSITISSYDNPSRFPNVIIPVTFTVPQTNNTNLQIITSSMPDATIGQPYSTQIQVSGGTGPYNWSTISTTYPSGCCVLGLNGNSAPTVTPSVTFNTQSSQTVVDSAPAGTYTWLIQVTDANGNSATKNISLNIKGTGTTVQTFQITTNTLPPATVGKTYATGIYYSYTGHDSLNSSFTNLPPGLYTGLGQGSLTNIGMTPATNGGTGTVYLNGTPTQAGNYTFTLYIQDPSATGNTIAGINKQFTIQVNPSGTSNNITPTSPLVSGPRTVVVGNSTNYSFSSTDQDNDGYNGGSLIYKIDWGDGSTVSSQNGLASGVAYSTSHTWTSAGNYTITVTATPGLGNTVQEHYVVQVVPTKQIIISPTPTPTPTPTGSGINLPDGTVIKLPSSPTVYLVVGGQLKPFSSSQDFLGQGYKWSDVQQVTSGQISNTGTGSGNSGAGSSGFYPYPSGSIVNDNGTIYFIYGSTKIPFTNYDAFTGLGYSLRNVVQGDLTNYTPNTAYAITTADAAHPWGSWLIYKGTVYYSTPNGLIGVPNSQTFTSNGGNWNLLIKANTYDIGALNSNSTLPALTPNDSRIYSTPTN